MANTVLYEQQDNVAIISLNRPDSLNGFTTELCAELLQAFEKAQSDEGIRVIVLTGEGRAFSAGADLKQGFVGDRTTQGKLLFEYAPVLTAIAEIPKPVIAAVPGFAAGIGLSFALHSDLLVMADDAFLLSPFTTISLVPDGGANWLLVRQLGYHRAYQLSIESERVTAARCLELGIANKVVPASNLRDASVAWAGELSKRAPLSLAATKKVMRHAMDHDWHSCFTMEAQEQQKLRESEDAKEGVDAFFEKRAPNFKGK
ncbi:MAG: enoyl-CoA hydratase/isomerase family protein [Gammaproteobacteria bacterium]|nr:enoyl-CoA hydratase/isomerase family protein [Gammaproteobacteria bacterium]MDH5239606.1 enoyl-CoA hydratase/isomerase family protein [Gammaproteobacteria bacterium]MDH5261058.1 enoyl-CoA hydratase/isomerase family protein [Gammaproteobacteria bacterium]MDH5582393.1 enoyl-CoA hydratase/isomerase family protein [Gammaproteobacteria bacterium]